MVTVNNIQEQTAELFTPEGVSLGIINVWQFNDVRIQLKEQKLNGYYCMFYDEKCNLDSDGRCDNWPDGFFDLTENQLIQLL